MGRVDDALRKAGAGRTEAPRGAGSDALSLATEPFPSEEPAGAAELFPVQEGSSSETAASEPEVQHVAAAAAQTHTEPVEDVPLAEYEPPRAPSSNGNGAEVRSVFEHKDTKMAGKIVIDQAMNPAFREQYRRLAASLHQAQAEHGMKVIMVVSAVVAEGKTLTAANLALTLSESYRRRVLLIDGDLRRPSLHTVFNVPAGKGLSEGLFAADDARMPLYPVTERLALLTAGRPTSDPLGGLTSDRMRRVISEARSTFDWVIVDTPPVGLLPDGHLLASMGDGALLVVKASDTSYKLVQRAIDSVGRDRVLGVVLNKADAKSADGYYYRYEYRPDGVAAQ